MFSVPECWRPMVPIETKELRVFQSCESPTSSVTYPVSPHVNVVSRTFVSEWLQKNPCCSCMAEYGTSSAV